MGAKHPEPFIEEFPRPVIGRCPGEHIGGGQRLFEQAARPGGEPGAGYAFFQWGAVGAVAGIDGRDQGVADLTGRAVGPVRTRPSTTVAAEVPVPRFRKTPQRSPASVPCLASASAAALASVATETTSVGRPRLRVRRS